MEDIIFFINGCYNVINKGTILRPKYEYIIRFLTETRRKKQIKIIISDNNNNNYGYETIIDGLTLIKINVTKFIDDYNYNNNNYVRLNYEVYIEDIDKYIYNGSFPIITENYKDPINFIIASSNLFSNKLGFYYKYIKEKLVNNKIDLIIHNGNLINGNYVYKKSIGRNLNINNEYRKLYQELYSDKHFGNILRNCLNIMNIGNYDIHSSFGCINSIKIKDSNIFNKIYKFGMTNFLKYQYQLTYDVEELEIYEGLNIFDILRGKKDIYNYIDIGDNRIILLDERNEVYHKQILFSNEQIEWVNNLLNTNKEIFIVSNRPIGNISKISSYIYGFINGDYKDELLHPLNYDRTNLLIKLFIEYYKKNNTPINILSGNVNDFYRNKIIYEDITIAYQIVSGYNDNNMFNSSIMAFLDDYLMKYDNLKFSKKIKEKF